jgi:hypothetical protein
MAYQTGWLYPGRIISVTFSENVTIDDVKGAYAETRDRLTGSGMTHMVINTLPVTQVDFALPALVSVMQKSQYNVGWRILITQNRMIRMFSSIAFQAVSMRFRVVATPDEALAFLASNDDSLTPLIDQLQEDQNAL